jgi:hypothetical protein
MRQPPADLHVLLCARTPESPRNHALTQLMSDLLRTGRATHLVLRPFERTELDEMIDRHRVGASSVEMDADRLMQLSGGNPMLAHEVLTWPSRTLPPAVVAIYERFLEHVTSDSRAILRAAAEVGSGGDPAQVAARLGASELDVIDALDEVAAGRIVHIERDGASYRFVTELARRVILQVGDTNG